jgi:PKD repeat protein
VDTKPLFTKWLVIGIILLFVGVNIAPTINFNTVKASGDKNLIQSSRHARFDPIIWDNYGYSMYDSTALSSQLDFTYPFNSQVADDFILDNDSRVTGVHWWGVFFAGDPPWPNPCDFNIIFYADDGTGNMPTGAGMEDPTSTALAVYFMPQVNGTVCGPYDDWFEYNVSFPTQFNITADTKYWIAIQAVINYSPDGQWGWSTNGNANPEQLHNPVQGFPVLGTPYWTDTTYGDMAFQLYGGLNIPPVPPRIHGTTTGEINVNYKFWTEPITDPSGDTLYCRWDWGDGNITNWLGPFDEGSVLIESHTWTREDVYDIRAQLKGVGGESNWSEPHTITIIENDLPVVDFTYTTDELTVTFDASFSYDPDGVITDWLWEFGDGTDGTGEIITHTYSTSGAYDVELTVVDDYDDEASITKRIEIEKYQGGVLFGRISNLQYVDQGIIFNAVNLKVITFKPFASETYHSGQLFTVSRESKGFFGYRFVIGFCEILV